MQRRPSDMEPWEPAIERAGTETAARCAHRMNEAPAVAVCIAGSARSYTTRLVQTHLRYNLLKALASPSKTRIFLHLKLNDSDKTSGLSGQKFRSHKESSLLSILATMEQPWIAKHIGEAVVLNGSGSFSGEGCRSVSSGTCIVEPETESWKDYRITACTDTARAMRSAAGITRPAQCCTPNNHWAGEGNNEERLLLSQLSAAWCGGAIRRYEHAKLAPFDLVVYTRPDAVWWQPVVPWCEWPVREQGIACDYPACDMAWMVPRQHFDRMVSLHTVHRDCPAFTSGRGKHTCCTTNEHLLMFARVHINATHRLPDGLQLKVSSQASAKVYKGVSILRSTKGVCEIVLHPVLRVLPGQPASNPAGTWAFKHQQKSGMLIKTTMRLRKLFRGNETITDAHVLASEMRSCKTALSLCGPGGYPIVDHGALMDSHENLGRTIRDWGERVERAYRRP